MNRLQSQVIGNLSDDRLTGKQVTTGKQVRQDDYSHIYGS
jgi:hypothetical protein